MGIGFGSSPRRITIHINGEEVEAFVKQIRAEMNKLCWNEQNRMAIGCSPFPSCHRFAARIPILRGTRLPRRDIACVGPISTHPGRPAACLRRLRGAKSFLIGIYRAYVPAGTWGDSAAPVVADNSVSRNPQTFRVPPTANRKSKTVNRKSPTASTS